MAGLFIHGANGKVDILLIQPRLEHNIGEVLEVKGSGSTSEDLDRSLIFKISSIQPLHVLLYSIVTASQFATCGSEALALES